MAAVCAKCKEPLTMQIHDDDDDADADADSDTMMDTDAPSQPPKTVPDDVHLPCNHHFHWECLLDSYDSPSCPACSSPLITTPPSAAASTSIHPPEERILVNLHNEGGLQESIDLLPILQEESYLRAHPAERKSRAFLEFCRQGDHRAIADLLTSCREEEEEEEDAAAADPQHPPDQILRYRDPLSTPAHLTGLHYAFAHAHREVAWLLLLLASTYPEMEIPALVFQEAAVLGVMRADQTGREDIRGMRDARGRTAEDVAREGGMAVWNGWVGTGRLAVPGVEGVRRSGGGLMG